jgi:hypothetical protein
MLFPIFQNPYMPHQWSFSSALWRLLNIHICTGLVLTLPTLIHPPRPYLCSWHSPIYLVKTLYFLLFTLHIIEQKCIHKEQIKSMQYCHSLWSVLGHCMEYGRIWMEVLAFSRMSHKWICIHAIFLPSSQNTRHNLLSFPQDVALEGSYETQGGWRFFSRVPFF